MEDILSRMQRRVMRQANELWLSDPVVLTDADRRLPANTFEDFSKICDDLLADAARQLELLLPITEDTDERLG